MMGYSGFCITGEHLGYYDTGADTSTCTCPCHLADLSNPSDPLIEQYGLNRPHDGSWTGKKTD